MDELTKHRKKRLRALIDSPAYGGSQSSFAKAAGLTEGRVSQLLDPNQSFGERSARNVASELRLGDRYFEEGFGADATGELFSSEVGDAVPLKAIKRIPVIGDVKGGDEGYLEELQHPVGFGEGYVEYPTTDPNAYAVRVRGDSMHPRYRAGEFVIVEPNIAAQEGDDVVIVCANGRKMLKQLNWRRDGEVQLLSVNNGYAPMTVSSLEISSIQLVAGRVRRSGLKHD